MLPHIEVIPVLVGIEFIWMLSNHNHIHYVTQYKNYTQLH